MRGSRFTEEQIVVSSRSTRRETRTHELCRRLGVSNETLYPDFYRAGGTVTMLSQPRKAWPLVVWPLRQA